MVDYNKIIVMTKLGLADKEYDRKYRRINEYFRYDYIYRKNVWTRFCVITGSLFILAIYWANQILVKGINILNIDLKKAGTDAILFLVLVAVAYSLLGTLLASREYTAAQKYQRHYLHLLDRLDQFGQYGQYGDHAPRNEYTEEEFPAYGFDNRTNPFDQRADH